MLILAYSAYVLNFAGKFSVLIMFIYSRVSRAMPTVVKACREPAAASIYIWDRLRHPLVTAWRLREAVFTTRWRNVYRAEVLQIVVV